LTPVIVSEIRKTNDRECVKYIRGTVATRKTKCGGITSPLKVLREYLKWAETPTTWGNARACELAVAASWALRNIPSKKILEQEQIERKALRNR